MPSPPAFPLRIFYDGACVVCAAEVEHYVRQDRDKRLLAIDISAPDFDPQPYNLSMEAFQRQMHAIDADGVIFRGVEAFWAIWQAFPAASRYGLLGRLMTLPLINGLARCGYRLFARFRKYLPRRPRTCPDNACKLDRKELK